MSDDQNGEEFHAHAFEVPIPAALAEAMRRSHDRQHMAQDAAELEINRFLRELSVEHLLLLRRVLNCDTKSPSNNYFDGQCYAILLDRHEVDPETGKPLTVAALSEGPEDA